MELVERLSCTLFDVARAREDGVLVPVDPAARPVRFTDESVARFRRWKKTPSARRPEVFEETLRPRLDPREIGVEVDAR